MNTEELAAFAAAAARPGPCPACAALACPGWEALPAAFDRASLERVGILRDPNVEDPTVEEFHPDGTNLWSASAPIAPAFHPYNRCDVWRCAGCGRGFLRYTEYGGYYQEDRIRLLSPERIVNVTPR